MKREIEAAVLFLKRLFVAGRNLKTDEVEMLVGRLAVLLEERFQGHWYPGNPNRGHAHRCIRVNLNNMQDPVLLQASRDAGIRYSDLTLPLEFTLWVDPGEVTSRFGEENPEFPVASFSSSHEEDKDDATSSSEGTMSDYHSCPSSEDETTPAPTPPLQREDASGWDLASVPPARRTTDIVTSR